MSEALELEVPPEEAESIGYAGFEGSLKVVVNRLCGQADDSASSGGTPTQAALSMLSKIFEDRVL